MANQILVVNQFSGGISDAEKTGVQGSFGFGQKLKITDDPNQITVQPATTKVSASVATDLIKWIVPAIPDESKIYYYGDSGKIYRSNTDGTSFEELRAVAASNGQGMWLHNGFIYYTQNTQVGRYNISTTTFTDNWQTGLDDTSTSKFAPGIPFLAGFVVGHGNKVGWFDGSTWTTAKLTLPPGVRVRSLELINDYVAIGTWRGTAITDTEEGYVFFWDGTASTFNFPVATQGGGINTMLNSRNRMLSVIGGNGLLMQGYEPFNKLQAIPKLTLDKYVEVFPGAMSNWRGLAHIGVSGNTDSTTVVQGVYQWGSKSSRYPEALNFTFPISTGTTTGTTLKIGAVKGNGNNLFIGWRDGATYGVDRVLNSGNPYAQAIYESLIFDNGNPGKEKQAKTIKASHVALLSDESIQLGYKMDRDTSYATGTANSTVGSTETRLPIPSDARFYEFQWEVILNSAATTAPVVTSTSFEFDDGESERIF